MKLLFDQNLSPKLADRLSDLFEGSRHTREVGFAEASDCEVWDFAGSNGFAIVSKDNDFVQLSLLQGAPPKVIRLQVGNCGTERVESVLRSGFEVIATFGRSSEASLLVLPQARRITSP